MNVNDEIKTAIVDNATMFSFSYMGKDGNIDPCYVPGRGNSFFLFFDGDEQTVCAIDDVLTTKFVNGKCLNEIADELEDIDW